MGRLREWLVRVGVLLTRRTRHRDEDIQAELPFHRDLMEADLVKRTPCSCGRFPTRRLIVWRISPKARSGRSGTSVSERSPSCGTARRRWRRWRPSARGRRRWSPQTFVAGLLGAFSLVSLLLAGAWLEAELYGVRPLDPGTMTAAVATLLLVAVAAHLVPIRRALRVDPTIALRED